MNFFELAVGVVANLFVAAIVVGFLIVEVLPGSGRRDMDGNWQAPPPRDDDDGPARWPGG
jgi:hypothetical protein